MTAAAMTHASSAAWVSTQKASAVARPKEAGASQAGARDFSQRL
jgi:hypothetical protein